VICINAYLDIKLNVCKEKELLKTKTKHGRMLFMKIETGESVILVLHTPREKLLGILDEVSPAGVSIRAIDLSYFDDWCAAIANGEQYLPMSDYFIPMWRVERVTRDIGTDATPSMSDLFEQRTGHRMSEFQIN